MFEDVKEYSDPEREKNEYHFFYNHDERIKNAPQIVRDYYAGKLKPPRGFAVFYRNKANLFILLALVFFVGVAWIYTGFNKSRNYAKINELDCELSAFGYGDDVYASCRFSRNPKSRRTDRSEVRASFMAINADMQVDSEAEDFGTFDGGELFLRAKMRDFDIIRVDAIIRVDGIERELSALVKR